MKTEGIDKLGISLYLIISLFAVANIYSVKPDLGMKQLIFFGISLFVGIVIFIMRTKFFENFASVIYLIGVLLLVGLFPFGKEILGQKNWYKFGSFTMQPVEFAKIGVALMLANYVSGTDFNLNNRKTLLTTLAIIGVPAVVVLAIPDVGSLLVFLAFVMALYREGLSGWFFGVIGILGGIFFTSLILGNINVAVFIGILANCILIFYINEWKNNLLLIGFILLVEITFIYLLNSNNSLLYLILKILSLILNLYLIFLILKLILNISKGEESLQRLIITGIIILVSGILISMSLYSNNILQKLPKHQRERIEVLFKGEKAFRDTSGYNLLYSKTAIGSGGFWGKGYREGSVTQGKFVPEQETDYIFCTVGEEWGFFGATLLISIYALFIGRIYYLAESQKSVFNRVFGYSFASILLMHFSINLGMVLGLFPTVGIPLPYFSYGGSSFLAFSIMTAIFFKLNYADKNSLV